LIVIVVIAILATITIVSYNGVMQGERNSSRIQATSTIITSMKAYAASEGEDRLRSLINSNAQCIGTAYRDVNPGSDISCRFTETTAGVTASTPVNTQLYDAFAGVAKFSSNDEPVTQRNFGSLNYAVTSAPFLQYNVAGGGFSFQMDSGAPRPSFTLLSYRLEGADQDCKLPVFRAVSYDSALQR
jgi:type II secretory pathway pseudopilin PulG